MNHPPTYLALGDSMSIDAYTGVAGGGAVSQFFRELGDGWSLDDRTRDGCEMPDVPRDAHGDLITLTIGGNDLIASRDEYLIAGLARFADQHLELLSQLREHNPESIIIVGDVYAPAGSLTTVEERVVSRDEEIILSWWDLMDPFILTMPPGAMGRPLGVYSTFLPARSAQLSVNGKAATAKVFLADRFGKPASSCCLAWSESWTKPSA